MKNLNNPFNKIQEPEIFDFTSVSKLSKGNYKAGLKPFLLALTIIFLLLLTSCHSNRKDKERIVSIGEELMLTDFSTSNSINIPNLINMGDGLKSKIIEINKNTTGWCLYVESGDLDAPLGDDKADAVLFIDTDFENIAIRFKFDETEDKYHILGWATIKQ